MDESEIVKLAEIYEADEFIQILEDWPVPQKEKGAFFLEVGIVLYRFSYFSLASDSWNHALKYFLENKDRSGESVCYINLGSINILDTLSDFFQEGKIRAYKRIKFITFVILSVFLNKKKKKSIYSYLSQ